jgi:H/ACA ribonucleoprotein complex subunit 2
MGKKRAAEEGAAAEEEDAPKKLRLVSPIANPLADKKLTKKVLKTVKAAAGEKLIRRGVKEVVKALKKGETGLSIIAGDISPVEVICHVPILCEEKNVAYVYVPSKEDLGLASLTKRPTSIVLVKHGAAFADAYAECEKEVRSAFAHIFSFAHVVCSTRAVR